MQSKKENNLLLIGMEEVLRQTEPHTKKEPAQQARLRNTYIFLCCCYHCYDYIVEGRVCLQWPLMLILRPLTHDHTTYSTFPYQTALVQCWVKHITFYSTFVSSMAYVSKHIVRWTFPCLLYMHTMPML